MCGITGWIDWHHDLTTQVSVMGKMAATLSKRGPDDLNVWSSRLISLGHTRLTVVDPVGGTQPMSKENNGLTYRMVYNGELYNTEEIRKEFVKEDTLFNPTPIRKCCLQPISNGEKNV